MAPFQNELLVNAGAPVPVPRVLADGRRLFDAPRIGSMPPPPAASLPCSGAPLSLAETAEQVMGMPKLEEPVTTVEQLLALPDDGVRHELLDGEHVVTPAPELLHQRAVGKLFRDLAAYLDERRDLEVFTSPADVILGSRILVQPDLFVARVPPGGWLRKWQDVGVPALVIEVLSPGTAARDRGKKRLIYQREGVAEYWIVDLDARLVERWRPADERPEIARDRLVWKSGPSAPPLEIELQPFFGRVHEDTER